MANATRRSLEEELSQQADLIELADAWMEKTGGEIVPGMVIDREGFLERIVQLPIWRKIEGDIGTYVRLIGLKQIKKLGTRQNDKNAYLLQNALTVEYVLRHFLKDPDYCSDKHNPFGSPKKLSTVLESYSVSLNGEEGGFNSRKGDCTKIYKTIRRRKLTYDELLGVVGLSELWMEHEKSVGMPREIRKLAKKTIEHFLQDPDYSKGAPSGGYTFGSPKRLKLVLRDYSISLNNGEGGYKTRRGDCNKIQKLIERGRLTEQQLLDAIGLAKKWSYYENSTGISKDYRTVAYKTLVHFLMNPHYCGYIKDTRNPVGAPKKLLTVLRDYSISFNRGKGRFKSKKGDCYMIHGAINEKKMTGEQLLTRIGLKQAWNDYQKSFAQNPFVFNPKKYKIAA